MAVRKPNNFTDKLKAREAAGETGHCDFREKATLNISKPPLQLRREKLRSRKRTPKGVHPAFNLPSCTKRGLGAFKEGLASRGGRAGKEQGSQRQREGEGGRGTKKEREMCGREVLPS